MKISTEQFHVFNIYGVSVTYDLDRYSVQEMQQAHKRLLDAALRFNGTVDLTEHLPYGANFYVMYGDQPYGLESELNRVAGTTL